MYAMQTEWTVGRVLIGKSSLIKIHLKIAAKKRGGEKAKNTNSMRPPSPLSVCLSSDPLYAESLFDGVANILGN